MPAFEWTATISAGQTHRWWTGGNGFYKHNQTPQLDAHAIPTFPEGIAFTGLDVPLSYGEFACKLESSDFLGNDLYTYYVTVKNIGSETAMYHMRVWYP